MHTFKHLHCCWNPAYKIHEFLCGWLKMEMQHSLHKSLIDRCSSETSVSRERLLSGQKSPVAWLDDDRWCQWDKTTSWIKDKEMWHWKIAWLKSFIWSNGPGLVSSSLSWGKAWEFLHDWASWLLEIVMCRRGMQNAELHWSCLINLRRAPTGCIHFFAWNLKSSESSHVHICQCSGNKYCSPHDICNTSWSQPTG